MGYVGAAVLMESWITLVSREIRKAWKDGSRSHRSGSLSAIVAIPRILISCVELHQ